MRVRSIIIAHLMLVLVGASISGCDRGDVKWNDPTTAVTVSMKGCQLRSTRGANELLLNIESDPLPDGRMQCKITTLRSANPK
jgi:hypothetical protein